MFFGYLNIFIHVFFEKMSKRQCGVCVLPQLNKSNAMPQQIMDNVHKFIALTKGLITLSSFVECTCVVVKHLEKRKRNWSS